jgi:hypothetical protein
VGISETIAAAMIGAIATVTTALFQLFMALRNKSKPDSRPKRGMTLRSILAVLALMVASAAGGFLYSEFMKQRSAEDMRDMRAELKALKEELTGKVSAAQPAAAHASDAAEMNASLSLTSLEGASAAAESIAYVPACRPLAASAPCSEAVAQRIALCAAIPTYARIDGIELYAQPDAVQNEWERHRAQFEQDLGGARFTGKSFEYAQSEDLKAVCVNFTQWSAEHPHIARMLVRYSVGDAPAVESAPAENDEEGLTPIATPAVVAADAIPGPAAQAVLREAAAPGAQPLSANP